MCVTYPKQFSLSDYAADPPSTTAVSFASHVQEVFISGLSGPVLAAFELSGSGRGRVGIGGASCRYFLNPVPQAQLVTTTQTISFTVKWLLGKDGSKNT